MMPVTNLNQRAQKELCSLFKDGWVILYTLQLGGVKYAAIRHPKKGVIIELAEEGRQFTLKKYGQVIKTVKW